MVIRVQLKQKKKTMKKTYINPEMEIVKIATCSMIATSDPNSGARIDTSADPITDPSGMEGREFDW